MNRAILEAADGAGIQHPHMYKFNADQTGFDTLEVPLQKITARMFDDDQAWVKLHYAFERNNLQGPGTSTALRATTVTDPTIVYREVGDVDQEDDGFSLTTGLPLGTLTRQQGDKNLGDENDVPQPKAFRRSAIRLLVPAQTPAFPHLVFERVNHINSDEPSFVGATILPQRARFDGMDVEWEVGPFSSNFNIMYQFTVVSLGHWRHRLVYPDASAGPAAWDTEDVYAYPQVPFIGNFPGLGGTP
jgi:hypothetical protein